VQRTGVRGGKTSTRLSDRSEAGRAKGIWEPGRGKLIEAGVTGEVNPRLVGRITSI